MLTFAVLLAASSSEAGQLSAIVNGRSFHVGAIEHWNESNYGLGVEYEFSGESRWKWKVLANGFVDSAENMSYMAGGGLHRRIRDTSRFHNLRVDVCLNAFLMTRDDVDDNRPFPGALPSVSVGNRYVGANLTYLPRTAVKFMYQTDDFDRGITGVIFLQLKLNSELFGLKN